MNPITDNALSEPKFGKRIYHYSWFWLVVLLAMYGTYLVAKFAIAALDTPFVYLGVRWAEKGD